MAASLNLAFFNESVLNNIIENNYSNDESIRLAILSSDTVHTNAKKLIETNLFRHNYIFHPILNYCQQQENFNYLKKSIDIKKTNFVIQPLKIKYSPRFIHYHELCLFYNYKKWFQAWDNKEYNSDPCEYIYDKYNERNTILPFIRKKNKISYPSEIPFAEKERKIFVGNKARKDKLRIGIVNAPIDFNNSFNSLNGKPNLSFNRLDEINQVLNSCLGKKKCDIIIFPEISIPYQWIPILTTFAKRNQVAIICGVEHIVNKKKEVLNFVATILPFTHNEYNNALIDFRLKIDYSPEEIEQITGRFFEIPTDQMEKEQMSLYVWNNVHFSVFNCFELADISKRAKFRGEVDFLATVEHNQDVNYFSNITESVARDIHSYIIQVNNSIYGDSRITRPSETFKKDVVKIKGGENILAIIDVIDITRLRNFQKIGYNLQKEDKSFKPTPPNFIISETRKNEK